MDEICLVVQESDVDGEILINIVPCATLEAAKRVLSEEKEMILNESHHFGGMPLDEFEVEQDDMHFYISDPDDSYYENITIVKKEIVK